jgi:hypothetical protein
MNRPGAGGYQSARWHTVQTRGEQMKQGHPLKAIEGFGPDVIRTLRDELSVTTAEEFLHFFNTQPDGLAQLLSTSAPALTRFAQTAASALDPAVVDSVLRPAPVDYPFRTGLDAPAGPSYFNPSPPWQP